MTAIEKFTFSLNFDDADNVIRSAGQEDEHYELGKKKKKKEEEEAPPPPPAIYTEEQGAQMVADAEKRGHEQGYAEGHKQGYDDAHQQIMASLEKAVGDVESEIAEKLSQIDEQQKRANARINEDAIHVALGIVRKLAPAWSKQYQLTEIEEIVRQCLANLFDVPKVMIKVHPDLEKDVRIAVERIAVSRGFSGKVIVVGEPDIAAGDCQVSWGDGTAVRDSARVWSEINTIIDNALALHASDHGLSGSDMGDPAIQESRMPSAAPEPETAETPPADAQETVTHVTSTSPSQEPPSSPEVSDQEVDGTLARNMKPSQDDTMQMAVPDTDTDIKTAAKTDAPHASEPEPVTQEQATPHATETEQATDIPDNAPDQATAPAQNAGPLEDAGSAPTQTHETHDPTTTADMMDAVKQPTKDAGDENG